MKKVNGACCCVGEKRGHAAWCMLSAWTSQEVA
jgi:hypothetical protein